LRAPLKTHHDDEAGWLIRWLAAQLASGRFDDFLLG
jgi:hypothetical protein